MTARQPGLRVLVVENEPLLSLVTFSSMARSNGIDASGTGQLPQELRDASQRASSHRRSTKRSLWSRCVPGHPYAKAPTLEQFCAVKHVLVSLTGDAGFAVCLQPADPIMYTCQPAALKRAVCNLLDNAVKYGKSGTVEVRSSAETIEISVDDQGPGIAVQELKRVLEPFNRLDESRNRETCGVGLGLAIAQSIVQAHGGTLMLSNRPAGGLRATITLPLSGALHTS